MQGYSRLLLILIAKSRRCSMPRPRKTQEQTTKLLSLPGTTPSGLLDTAGAAKWLGVSRTKLFEFMHQKDWLSTHLGENGPLFMSRLQVKCAYEDYIDFDSHRL